MKKIYSLLYNCDPSNSLGGSCNRDIKNVANLLNSLDGYQHRTHLNPEKLPFKEICQEFIAGINTDEIVIVYLSGHGYQTKDTSKDERDGYDEYIMTKFGMVLDDDINRYLIQQLPKNIKFIGISDTCHSATMFDLDNEIKLDSKYNRLSIGACLDFELENCNVGNEVGFGGALTIELLESKINEKCLLENVIRCYDDPKIIIAVKQILTERLKPFGQHPAVNCQFSSS